MMKPAEKPHQSMMMHAARVIQDSEARKCEVTKRVKQMKKYLKKALNGGKLLRHFGQAIKALLRSL